MTSQQPELRPDPFEGPADTEQDPTVAQGSFPFENYESSKASILFEVPANNVPEDEN